MSVVQVFIDGVDRTGVIAERTLQVHDVLAERSTATFAVNDLTNSLSSLLVPGESVQIVCDDVTIFGGEIDNVSQISMGTNGIERQYSIQCVDWIGICDKRVVAESYENILAGNVLRDIVTKYLAAEGVTYTVDSIQDGPTVIQAVFNYAPATTCIDRLAELAGYNWWIDASKVMRFVERATYTAPWALDDAGLVTSLEVRKDRVGYRNRQYVRAGKDITDPQTESFKGDGANRTFTLGFPVAKVPTITLNGAAQTVGIKGLEEGKNWYWNKGDATITQDSAGTLLTSTDTLAITYQGLFDVVVLTDDMAAIEERKSVEGGTGYYEAVDDDPYLDSREAAIQSANAKLRKYSKLGRNIVFNTCHTGLKCSQILTVNLVDWQLVNEEFLVEQVTFSQLAGQYWNYEITAVSGEPLGSWTRFFRAMAERGQTFVIRENIREDLVLVRLVQSAEGWKWSEGTPITVNACPIPSDSLYPSATLYPC